MCSQCDAPAAKASRAATPQSVPAQRRKTHPVTWVATAAIIPLLCWDAWQTYKEARLPKALVDVKLGPVARDGATCRAWTSNCGLQSRRSMAECPIPSPYDQTHLYHNKSASRDYPAAAAGDASVTHFQRDLSVP
jgi:hypothetical protein